MGSVIKSLKKLYKKMGGTNTKGINTVDGMVDKIAEKYEAGEDGKNVFVVQHDENGNIITPPEELLNFIKANKNVTHPLYVKNMTDDDGSVNLIISMIVDPDETFFYVLSYYASMGELGYQWVSYSSDDPGGCIIYGEMGLFPVE